MRRFFILLCLVLPIFSSGVAQTATNEEQLLALVKAVQAQQAQIADNQAKIDAKLADVAEAVRVARIWAERSN